MTVFDATNKDNHLKSTIFFGRPVTIARFDTQKYPFFEKLTNTHHKFFWQPEEVELLKDANDFKQLNESEQHIFTSNLKRQILLDSVQGRAPSLAFLPIVSLPEVESWIQVWTFFESIHSRSYSHLIRNVYPDPSVVFDSMLDIQEVVDCAKDISSHYDDLIQANAETYTVKGSGIFSDELGHEHKRRLWLCLMSVNILEGIRFYASFGCSWAFAELKKMEGNAKIIKLICRDENLHLAATQQLLKILPKDDPDFIQIKQETEQECVDLFISAANQEKVWADYLFRDGSIIGLNAQLLHDYIDWLTHKRMQAVGLTYPGKKVSSNPLPWTQKWIAGSDVQIAPQESQLESYIIGGIKADVSSTSFKGFKL